VSHTTSLNPLKKQDSNRLELLLFYIGSKRRFGINVLKVQEVIPCPHLNQLPDANPNVLGVYNLRGNTIPIIHLARAIAATRQSLDEETRRKGSVITAEINRHIQGLWVSGIDKIVVIDWKDIKPPNQKGTMASYTTGITLIDNELVQILDIEKVLAEVLGMAIEKNLDIAESVLAKIKGKMLLIVDDSSLAIKQTIRALDNLGLQHITAVDGREGLDVLRECKEGGIEINMIISDIEMPEMDGYSFVSAVREMPEYKDIHVLMHTSLNGKMNLQKAITAGANDILTKFVPNELAEKVAEHLLAK